MRIAGSSEARLWPSPSHLGQRDRLQVIHGSVNSVVGYAPKDADKFGWSRSTRIITAASPPSRLFAPAEAIAYFTQQIAREPRHAGGFLDTGEALSRTKRPRAGEADIDRAIQIEPRRAALYATRGMISIQEGKLDQVLLDCNRAIELDSAESWAYVIRANVWLAKRDSPHALADLNSVIRIDGAHPLDWSARFRYWLHVKDRDYANRDKNEGARLEPDSAMSHLWRGDVWCADQECDVARSPNIPRRSESSRSAQSPTLAAPQPGLKNTIAKTR